MDIACKHNNMALSGIANLKLLPVTNFKRCVICQAFKKHATLCNVKLMQNTTYTKLLNCLRERNELQDTKYLICYQRMAKEDHASLKLKGTTWHRKCYGDVTNSDHIKRIKRDQCRGSYSELDISYDDSQPTMASRVPITRSTFPLFNKEMFFLPKKKI